jgi:hypothetical protein
MTKHQNIAEWRARRVIVMNALIRVCEPSIAVTDARVSSTALNSPRRRPAAT